MTKGCNIDLNIWITYDHRDEHIPRATVPDSEEKHWPGNWRPGVVKGVEEKEVLQDSRLNHYPRAADGTEPPEGGDGTDMKNQREAIDEFFDLK